MKIVIGLIEHIGDIVACEPVSRYVREKYPDAHVSWAVLPRYRELIDTNPHIDQTIVIECLTEWIRLSAHGAYDEVVDLHVNYRICEHCRVPLVKAHGNPFVNAYEWLDYGALLEAFSVGAGLPKLSAQPQIYLGPEHKASVDELGLPDEYCVIHRDSNDVNKDWSLENWRLFAHWMSTALQLPVVDVGASSRYTASPLGVGVDLINRTSILETAEVIRRARLFVGVDSGPAHLANATLTPGIVLLGRYNMFRQYMPFTGFYASDAPEVKLVRNGSGPVRDILLADVIEATRYSASILRARAASGVPLLRSSAPVDVSEHDRRMVRESKLFDPSWYLAHYPEAKASELDPLDHFIVFGGRCGFSPGPGFDATQYLRNYADVARAGLNPLLHYIEFGKDEGRQPLAVAERQVPEVLSNANVVPIPAAFSRNGNGVVHWAPADQMPRTFAFYLPQFHPIAQNNIGHRMGFTEWDNVIKAKPLFEGHYQPRVPGELGYYDLRALDVIRDQVHLAKSHGISGFCFYYYYFHGQRLLYKPIENFINSDIDYPFFFLWANENWSRQWDGGDSEIIIAQQHSPEDDLAFIRGLVEVFSDPRYVKIDGKPILMVYKTHRFPNVVATTELWRAEILKHGFPGLYLVMVDDWTADPDHPRVFGFDAAYEIPSNIVTGDMLSDERDELAYREEFNGRIVDYRKFAQYHMSRPFPEYKRFRTVMLPWDNTPRYGSRAMVHVNTGGPAYEMWLTQALLDTYNRYRPEERIVFLHSWNEWCEGTYLEPDGRWGRRYLEETRAAIDDVRAIAALGSTDGMGAAAALLRQLARERDIGSFRLMNQMRTQCFYAYRELENVRAELAWAQAHRQELLSALEECRAERAEMQTVASMLDSVADVETTVETIRSTHIQTPEGSISTTTSWQLTAPLRWLTRRLRAR